MRLIDADSLIALVQDSTILGAGFKQAFIAIVNGEPTVEPPTEPERKTSGYREGYKKGKSKGYKKGIARGRKTGQWILTAKGAMATAYECSVCGRSIISDTGYDVYEDYPFCHCGARMTEDEG